MYPLCRYVELKDVVAGCWLYRIFSVLVFCWMHPVLPRAFPQAILWGAHWHWVAVLRHGQLLCDAVCQSAKVRSSHQMTVT
eukprot:s81_g7.t1